jgi:hypothetical protein
MNRLRHKTRWMPLAANRPATAMFPASRFR